MNEFLTKRVVKATFDATSGATAAAHGLGVVIPKGAIITGAFIDVTTTFTSSTDAGTIAISVQGANDLVSAIAISDGTNVWDAGRHGTLAGSPALGADAAHDTAIEVAALVAASYIKTTANKEVTATVATEPLTDGKCDIYIEYVV